MDREKQKGKLIPTLSQLSCLEIKHMKLQAMSVYCCETVVLDYAFACVENCTKQNPQQTDCLMGIKVG